MPHRHVSSAVDISLDGSASRLLGEIRRYESTLVAFSGGADSALVLAAAVRALGVDRTAALTAVSPAVPTEEVAAAADFAARLGVRHELAPTDELAEPGYRANGPRRCYFCKSVLLDAMLRFANQQGYATVATGTNADDMVAGFRPGIQAGAQRGARTPLADAGLDKDEVRRLSRHWDLITWDKPATPCLSSRIAYGQRISADRLDRVGRAERDLRDQIRGLGLKSPNLRVRDLGPGRVRVEVEATIVDVVRAGLDVDALLARAGFDAATGVAVEPFRSGALNDALRPG